MNVEAALLAALSEWAFGFALVLTRVAAVVMLLPGMGELQLPQTVRAGLVLAFTLLLLPGVKDMIPAEPAHPLGLAMMVGAELLAGGTLGWLARLAVLALPMAGHFVFHMLGLSTCCNRTLNLARRAACCSMLLVSPPSCW